ncbi:MAG: hypothetical protein K9L62_10635 [Vallitaleaceae bacterium]|nr:hypothetical protein [Vallitaleaceae bacterium]
MDDDITTDLDFKEKENELERKKWRGRRKMAWVSLISMILITLIILFTDLCPESRLTILDEVITWFYFACASVIGAYMGATTYAHIKRK